MPDAAALDRKRALARERQRRHQARKAMNQAVGRFLVTEDLIAALVWSGEISNDDAMTTAGIERGVEQVLSRWLQSIRSNYL